MALVIIKDRGQTGLIELDPVFYLVVSNPILNPLLVYRFRPSMCLLNVCRSHPF